MADTTTLQPVREHGWAGGFANMFRAEAHKWLSTRFGLVQVAIWTLFMNGLLVVVLLGDMAVVLAEGSQGPGVALEPFVAFTTAFPAIGAIVLAQSAVVGEKNSGTAEWVLSAPVSRSAFLFSRLLALAVGCIVTMLLIPYAVAALEYSVIPSPSVPYPVGTMAAAMGMAALQVLFYLSLTTMLGTMFSSRAPVIGIAFAVYVVSQLVSQFVPGLANLTPMGLTLRALELVIAGSLTSFLPIVTTTIWVVIFMVLAVWRFQREDF